MASSTSPSGAETPNTEPSTTPEHSGAQTESRPALESRKGIDNLQVPKAPMRLKLNLPKIPEESGPEPRRSRRSLRAQKVPEERDSSPEASDGMMRKKKANDNKLPTRKLMEPLNVTGTTAKATQSSVPTLRKGLHHKAQGSSLSSETSGLSAKSNPGDVYDPIDVDALPSPPPPHMFAHRHMNYHVPMLLPRRPKEPPMLLTPNGARILAGKVSGNQSHDMYRGYIDRRDAPAPPGFADSCTRLSAEVLGGRAPSVRFLPSANEGLVSASRYGHIGALVPVLQHSTPLPTQRRGGFQGHRTNPHSYHTPVNAHSMQPVLDETHLRQRAVQFVLDHTRPHPRKRRLADDPDETSSSEYEEDEEDLAKKKKKVSPSPLFDRPTTPIQPRDVTTPSTDLAEEGIFDRNLKLSETIEHTELLTAMLMTYPRSEDQKGLREDIAMLADVTNKRLSSWVSAEEDFELDTQQRVRLAHTLSPHVSESSSGLDGEEMARIAHIATNAAEAQKKQQDDEVRKYLYPESTVEEDSLEKPQTGGT